MEDRKTEIINLVMRQTNYDKDTIVEKLEANNNNYLAFVLIKTFPTSLHPNNLITLSSSIIAIFLTLIFRILKHQA